MKPVDDRTALALTMIGEARSQGIDGMQDVGHTIINRANHPSWRGKTVMEVCLKPWQYSCWNENDPNRGFLIGIPKTDPLYNKALDLSANLIAGKLPDTTNGATYYFKVGSPIPTWAVGHKACYINDRHLFFKDIS